MLFSKVEGPPPLPNPNRVIIPIQIGLILLLSYIHGNNLLRIILFVSNLSPYNAFYGKLTLDRVFFMFFGLTDLTIENPRHACPDWLYYNRLCCRLTVMTRITPTPESPRTSLESGLATFLSSNYLLKMLFA